MLAIICHGKKILNSDVLLIGEKRQDFSFDTKYAGNINNEAILDKLNCATIISYNMAHPKFDLAIIFRQAHMLTKLQMKVNHLL